MKLSAKIKSKYLDDILAAKKKVEYRNIESLTLTDENNRIVELEVIDMETCSNAETRELMRSYSDVPWTGKPITAIRLGKILRRTI